MEKEKNNMMKYKGEYLNNYFEKTIFLMLILNMQINIQFIMKNIE